MPVRSSLACLAVAVLVALPVASAQNLVACQNGAASGYACDGVDLYARVTNTQLRTGSANDVWGWTDPQTGREYALAGTRSGTGMVDITDPSNPILLGKLLTSSGNSTWRDIKVYQNYAFVVSESNDHGMQVFDLTRLRGLTPDQNRDFTEDFLYRGPAGNRVGDAHNIVINEDTGFAYIVGSDDCNGGLHMVNIQDPLNSTFAGCFGDEGYVHDAQCVLYDGPDTDYTGREICVTSNGDATVVVDVTDKTNPAFVSRVFYPSTAYAHQGWFTENKRFFIADDESDEIQGFVSNTRTIVFDLEDLDSPSLAFQHFGALSSADHNLYVRGNYAFLSNYESGLRILDLTAIDSGFLTEIASFDTYPSGNSASYSGQWSNYPFFESGTVIATDQANGLFVLRPAVLTTSATPEVPTEEGFSLSAASPNPFADRTALSLAVAAPQRVTAELLDLTGRRVALLHEGAVGTGPLPLVVDGADLPSGLYLVRVTGETFTASQRLSLVR